MKLTFGVEGARELLQSMDGAYAMLVRERRELVRETARNVRLDAQAGAPEFTGDLSRRITARVSKSGASATVKARAPHAWIIGRGGRKPGAKLPPRDKLEYWRIARGIRVSAFALARSIARKGIEPQPFLDEAWAAHRPQFLVRMEKLVDRFVAAASGRR